MTDFDVTWMAEQVGRVVLAAVDRDNEAVADAISAVGERYGSGGVYALCCGLAEAITRMGDYTKAEGGDFYGFETVHVDRGPIAPEDVDEGSKPVMVAMRFVTAYLNGDSQQQLAIFFAAETPEQAMEVPIGLVNLVGAYGRDRLDRASKETS